MRKIALILCVAAAVATASADINEYTVNVGEFNKLKVQNNLDVVYKCSADSAGKAVFVVDDSLADAYMFTNKGGTLKIEKHTDYAEVDLPALTVYSNFLNKVENSALGTVQVATVASCPEFEIKVVGNGTILVDSIQATKVKAKLSTGKGTIVVVGQCNEASLSTVGSGMIQADRLEAEDVSCSAMGTGSISCYPLESLKIKGLGSTTIYYRGRPKQIKKSGLAKVEPLK